MNSINYYNNHSLEFINNTLDADMSKMYQIFESYVPKGHILDLGCGSGRDSFYFSYKYKVTSVDGSKKMIDYCNSVLSNKVVHSTFEGYETDDRYDGIWACASLLHVGREQLSGIIDKYIGLLSDQGIFYMSFKHREDDFATEKRHFTCFTKPSLEHFINQFQSVEIQDIIVDEDVRDHTNDTWISVILKKNT